jgi:hypothetical protein
MFPKVRTRTALGQSCPDVDRCFPLAPGTSTTPGPLAWRAGRTSLRTFSGGSARGSPRPSTHRTRSSRPRSAQHDPAICIDRVNISARSSSTSSSSWSVLTAASRTCISSYGRSGARSARRSAPRSGSRHAALLTQLPVRPGTAGGVGRNRLPRRCGSRLET